MGITLTDIRFRMTLWIAFIIVLLLSMSMAVYSWLTAGKNVVKDSQTNWLIEMPIAHRGLHSNDPLCPENSSAAFERAINAGYAIELDVHLLSDGKLAVFHDDNLARMTGIDKPIIACTSNEIRNMKLLHSEHGIPMMDDVLKLVHGKVPLLIEIKNKGKVGNLEQKLLDGLKDYQGKFAIQSFNPYSVKWFKINAPHILRGQLSGSFDNENLAFYKKFLLTNLLLNFESRPGFIAYEIKELPKGIVKRLSGRGLYVLGWTAKNEEEYKYALKYCDNVIFEGFKLQR